MVDNPGDLGRRVSERRHELGLSVEQVAARALMDPAYLETLEASPSSQLSKASLWRLAAALDTTLDALSGGGTQLPPGRSAASPRPVLESMSREECEALIGAGGVGRVVFVESGGPAVFPVNYKVIDGDVVFRTDSDPALQRSLESGRISFEIDRIDDALAEGWSVVISGIGSVITDAADLERAQAAGITPWAGGERNTFIRIGSEEITGRRIRRL